MRYRRIFSSVLAVGLVAMIICAVPSAGANLLEDISVNKAGDTLVVTITTSEPCGFDTLLITDKPERIVVDLEGVTNVWTQKKFGELPLKSIRSIRTSQFQEDPLVTRVVLDIEGPVQFTAEQKGNNIMIAFPVAQGETDFAEWHAQGTSSPEPPPAPVSAPEPVPVPAAAEEKAESATSAESPTPEVSAAPVDTKLSSAGVKIESYPKRKVVTYDTPGYRDPFMPLVGTVPGQISTELPVIENLKLVGILEDIDGNRALLEDAEGNGYILQPNDKVKNGYLVSVTESKAIFQITEYGWTRTVALELNLPELR